MQDIQLVPLTPEQMEVLGMDPPDANRPLTDEVSTLRGAFRLVARALARRADDTPEDDPNKNSGHIALYAGMLCRLSDSIVRTMLATQKLARSNDQMARVHAELKRVLHEIGWREQP